VSTPAVAQRPVALCHAGSCVCVRVLLACARVHFVRASGMAGFPNCLLFIALQLTCLWGAHCALGPVDVWDAAEHAAGVGRDGGH
jgi:hypothetical protein